jgi:Holliday junction resolvase RusA-like endonuclease
MYITIDGDPIPKKRPRFWAKGNRAMVTNTQQKEENIVRNAIRQQIGEHVPFQGAVAICMTFYLKRPKAHYGTGKNSGQLKGSAPNIHTKKPDLDNLEKFVLDVCNGLIFKDDAQIYTIQSSKQYDENPRTTIAISGIDKE